ncbi:MFS transporter [Jatrophihabitans sp. DSM 45814]
MTGLRRSRTTAVRRSRTTAVRRWAVAVTVYLVAVFHRTSLGVAGLQASARFGISPSQLSIFVLLQLGVYAGMQIPTGILVDRYGPRRLLLVAAGTMGLAQIMFAIVPNYPLALFARAMLGLGDALTFVSVLRFAAGQFSPRRYPLVVAMTGMVGTVGNIAATLPLATVLHSAGWTPTFLAAGALSLLSGLGVYLVLRKSAPVPRRSDGPADLLTSLAAVRRRVATAWSMAGTRAGFWVHFASMSTSLTFGVLWGVPFLVQGEGLSRNGASELLLAVVAFSTLASPVVGYFTGRFPAIRVPCAIGLCAVTVSGWYVLLIACPEHIPRPLLVAIVLITGLGGPVSAIGFALARDYNGPAIVGTATGVVNVGGFVAGIIGCLGIGWTLDRVGAVDTLAYRYAFAVAVSVQLVGLIQMIRWWLKARRVVLSSQDRGEATPVAIVRHRWDLGR